MLLVVLIVVCGTKTLAGEIRIDGDFADWEDKPFVSDTKHDIKTPGLDFLQVGYFADDEYLYLYVDRLSAKKSEPWYFHVVILNAEEGEGQVHYPFGNEDPISAPQFDITSYYIKNKNHEGTVVNVSFEGEELEETFSVANNGKNIEFRIPLSKVGLNGQNKEIEFMLKSNVDEKTGGIDWVPDGRKIIVTTGPTFWQIPTVILFSAVSFVAYTRLKRREISR